MSCAHKVHSTLGGRKDGKTEGRTEGRKAENYVPPLFFEKAGDKKTQKITLGSSSCRYEQKDLLGSFDTFVAHYKYMKIQTSLIPKRNEYEHHVEELELARQMMEDEQREYDQLK